MSIKKLFNDQWEFCLQDLESNYKSISHSAVKWESVEIPHDWLIFNTEDLYADGIGWYRRNLSLQDKADRERFSLRFEGVYMDSTLLVNGQNAGEWKYGYSTFELDITEFLKPGDNEIVVKVVHQSPNSRWYSGAGIYRNVWLRRSPATHLAADGIYISTEKKDGQWLVDISSEIQPDLSGKDDAKQIILKHSILDPKGNLLASSENPVSLGGKGLIKDNQVLSVSNPAVWDIESPELHRLKTELLQDGILLDSEEQTFGFRSIRFDCNEGFFLNERHVKLNGVCQHHDLGCLGAAVNKAALRRQFIILRSMGVNAIRTSHNMPAVELMELADEMGMLICSESFDMWENPKTPYDYARFFPEWHNKDVASWVRRDRNCPSVIMWCIGNEISDTHISERGQVVSKNLMDLVHLHDPKGNAPVTIGSNYMPWENARKCADIVKLAGYNYAEYCYQDHHNSHPDWMIYGSETSSIVYSRGIYHFPAAQPILSDDDEQCSALGNSTTSWGAKSIEVCITEDRDFTFSAGQFLWSGFDYLGEPTPYHSKNSYFGQVDTCGFPKDAYYVYKAAWTDYKTDPMVHIYPYWDFNPGQQIDIRVCSNAPKVELFFNGESLGTFESDRLTSKKLIGEWTLPYSEGELKALAYDDKGNVVAEDIQRSFGAAASVVVQADKKALKADGRDLIFLEIGAEDAQGNNVANANNRIHLQVSGAGRLLGIDNGDSTDYDQLKGTSKRLFSGKLLAVIGATLEAGEISVSISSPGLIPAEISLTSLEVEQPEGISSVFNNEKTPDNREIPVRKIAITSKSGQIFNEDLREMEVVANLLPGNATYSELQWRVTNNVGIDTNIAAIETRGNKAKVTALGDGEFCIRCMVKNGAEQVRLLSQLNFTAEGLGQAFFNPYEFISGGLYSEASMHISSGNERGIATPRDAGGYFAFRGLDFGETGADEITIPIFELESSAFPLQIWQGIPGEEGCEMLADVVYNKPSIWNTYQPETYKLSKKLTGINTLSFVTQRKAHFKGFQFTKLEKAYEKLEAKQYSQIYGDSFTIAEEAIEQIGNNVTLGFDGMDFGPEGCSKLILCGRSRIEKNSIRVQFTDGQKEQAQSIDFLQSDDYMETEYSLDPVTGLQSVNFIFLPGCNFDFKWFRFENKPDADTQKSPGIYWFQGFF